MTEKRKKKKKNHPCPLLPTAAKKKEKAEKLRWNRKKARRGWEGEG